MSRLLFRVLFECGFLFSVILCVGTLLIFRTINKKKKTLFEGLTNDDDDASLYRVIYYVYFSDLIQTYRLGFFFLSVFFR